MHAFVNFMQLNFSCHTNKEVLYTNFPCVTKKWVLYTNFVLGFGRDLKIFLKIIVKTYKDVLEIYKVMTKLNTKLVYNTNWVAQPYSCIYVYDG